MERLVDKSLTATGFAPDAQSGFLPSRARTVIIGGGIIGTSMAYHLARAGDADVLLLDKNVIGSGTTWHAAGLCTDIRSTVAMTDLAAYGIGEYLTLEQRSGIEVNFNQCGSILLARTQGRMDELRYTASVARQKGLSADLVTAEQIQQMWPLISTEQLLGGLHQPNDGMVNPGYVALAYAKLASEQGAKVREGINVLEVLAEKGRVVGVRTDSGDVSCDRIVLAAGLWSRNLAAQSGVNLPLYAAEHVHVRTDTVEGADASLPVLRDMDGYFYVRHEQGRLLVGAFEPDGIPRRVDEISSNGFAEFDPAWEHFEPVRANAEQRVPILKNTEFQRFLNAPEAFTPDSNFCMGESSEIENLFVSAGYNSQGIIFGPGAGKALADWMQHGSAQFDASAVDVRRFSKSQNSRGYLHRRTHESLGRLYAMHWPQLQPETARNIRRSPLHQRLEEANACFGETTAWERAQWFAPLGVEPTFEYSYGRQNWFEIVREEHRAARESVALFDLSSFTKVEVVGAESLPVLQRFCTANIDMAVGRARYTLMLNANGGIELDGTAVRLSEDHFWVITPASTQHKTLGMLRRLARGRSVAVFDATAAYGTIGVMGPNSRKLLEKISPEDWSNESQPFATGREVEIGNGYALSLRLSFVGELGYELYPTADQAVNLYDELLEAGQGLGVQRAGYIALDSLRSEKGYRHLGHDIGPADDPVEASLGFATSWKKTEPFIGREALEPLKGSERSRRMVYVRLKDPEPLLIHDESVLQKGQIVGRVTSGAYGYTLGSACGHAYISIEADLESAFEIDCGGRIFELEVSSIPFYDPGNNRLKS